MSGAFRSDGIRIRADQAAIFVKSRRRGAEARYLEGLDEWRDVHQDARALEVFVQRVLVAGIKLSNVDVEKLSAGQPESLPQVDQT